MRAATVGKEGGYLHGPTGVSRSRLRSFATTEVKETRTLVLYSVFFTRQYCISFGLGYPGAFPPRVCRLSEQKYLHLSWPTLQELNISPLFPLVNQQQIIFRAAERPWAGWLARRLSAPLSALFCLRATDRLHQTERSQSRGAAFCFSHTHHSRTLSYYRPIRENSRGRQQSSPSNPPGPRCPRHCSP